MTTATTTADVERKERLSSLTAPSTDKQQLAVVQPPDPQLQAPAPAEAPKPAAPLLFDSSMSYSDEIGEFVGALARAQGKFLDIERTLTAKVKSNRTGVEFSYDYAPLDVVLDAVRPALSENGIALMQFPSAKKGVVIVTTFLAHESGQWFKNSLAVGGPDNGDPQAVGSAIKYARRYALESMLGVSPSTDDDGEAAAQHINRANGNGAPVRPGKGVVEMPQRETRGAPPPSAAPPSSHAGTVAPSPAPGSTQTSAAFTVAECEPRTTKGPNPKPFWLVKFSNGVVASTFKADMGKALEAAKTHGTRYADVELTRKGQFLYIDQLTPESSGEPW